MRVLVAYASHLGATQGIAERIAETLRQQGVDAELASVDAIEAADGFDAYVVGSAVHAGHWLKPANSFVERNAAVLEKRPVWLFSSGPIGETAVHAPQPDPKEIGDFRRMIEPRAHIVFAGAFDRSAAEERGGLLERTFSRFIPEGDFRDWPTIEGWARGIASELSRDMVTA